MQNDLTTAVGADNPLPGADANASRTSEEWVTIRGTNIPKSVYEEIKQKAFGEAKRKAEKVHKDQIDGMQKKFENLVALQKEEKVKSYLSEQLTKIGCKPHLVKFYITHLIPNLFVSDDLSTVHLRQSQESTEAGDSVPPLQTWIAQEVNPDDILPIDQAGIGGIYQSVSAPTVEGPPYMRDHPRKEASFKITKQVPYQPIHKE